MNLDRIWIWNLNEDQFWIKLGWKEHALSFNQFHCKCRSKGIATCPRVTSLIWSTLGRFWKVITSTGSRSWNHKRSKQLMRCWVIISLSFWGLSETLIIDGFFDWIICMDESNMDAEESKIPRVYVDVFWRSTIFVNWRTGIELSIKFNYISQFLKIFR